MHVAVGHSFTKYNCAFGVNAAKVLGMSCMCCLGSFSQAATGMQVLGLYTKAKSPMHTAAFHEASAQADMDENHDFARAEASMQVRC